MLNEESIQFIDGKLSYIGQDCEEIPLCLANMYGKNATYLDLSYNCIHNLKSLQYFVSLETLILDNNCICDSSFRIPPLYKLHTLSLNKNKLRDLDSILAKLLSNTPELKHLSLLGNLACPNELSDLSKDHEDYKRYRYYVIYMLPNLQFLDSTYINENERMEATRRGKFMKVIKPSDRTDYEMSTAYNEFSPLPNNDFTALTNGPIYGKSCKNYTGKNSEGNRFIKNQHL